MRGAEWHFVCNYCEPHGHFRNDERGPADRAGAGGGELCFSAPSPAWGSREREFRVIQVESCFCRAFGRVSHKTD